MDFNQIAPILIFGVVGALLVAIVAYRNIQARKRREALNSIAPLLGFSFVGQELDHHPNTADLKTSIFNRGHGKAFSNIMAGNFGGQPVSTFDYRYTTGSGKDSHTWSQTVAAFSQELWLPEFELRPENFIDRIADHFTHKDIDFDLFREFSRRFLLRGASVDEIRSLFSPALIQFLQTLPEDAKWHIEGSSTALIVYKSDITVPADIDSYRDFLEKTSIIAKTFFGQSAGLSKPVR